jgi:hypothetical protein
LTLQLKIIKNNKLITKTFTIINVYSILKSIKNYLSYGIVVFVCIAVIRAKTQMLDDAVD